VNLFWTTQIAPFAKCIVAIAGLSAGWRVGALSFHHGDALSPRPPKTNSKSGMNLFAKQSRARYLTLDCFVAAVRLPATTPRSQFATG
jgi:hypothetical protein